MKFENRYVKPVVGFFLVLMVVFLWVSSSQMIQFIFSVSFRKPLFVTYFSTSLFMTYFVGFLIFPSWRALFRWKISGSIDDPNIIDVAINGLMMCPLWFAANISFNYSLSFTSVSSNTILSSTSSMFTFILSFLLRIERFSITRMCSVLFAFSGVILVTLTDSNSGVDSFLGHVLSLGGAFFYGSYTTFMKLRVSEKSPSQVLLLFAFVGFFNFILMWPLFFISHFSNLEPFEFPNIKVIGFLFLNGSIGTVLSDVFWALSVLFTSPIASTVGLSLSIPFSIFTDFILGKTKQTLGIQYVAGSILVIIAFLFVNLSYHYSDALIHMDTLQICTKSEETRQELYQTVDDSSNPILTPSHEVQVEQE